MTSSQILLALVIFLIVLAFLAVTLAVKLYVSAEPDQWLLRIRDGRLVEAGIGIRVLRRPGDVVALYSSTLQRVGFSCEALTSERLKVVLDGFILWGVSSQGDGPFLAFRSLGLANLLAPPAGLKHPKHLLTSPQHKAFQQMVAASVQRHASSVGFNDLLSQPDAFVAGLEHRLRAQLESMGLVIEQVQILAARPADAALVRDLGVREEEQLREQAALVRLEASERARQRDLEAATHKVQDEAAARRDRQLHDERAKLDLERQRTELLQQQNAARALQLEAEAALKRRQAELDHAQALEAEARALGLLEARLRREQSELDFAAVKLRRTGEAERDAALAALEVSERKTPAVREAELASLTVRSLARALKLTEARWVSVGPDSPMAGLGALLGTLRDAATKS